MNKIYKKANIIYFLVLPGKPKILDSHNTMINDKAGPYTEGENLVFRCVISKGNSISFLYLFQ